VKLPAWGVLLLGVLGFGCISYRGSAQSVTPSTVRADAAWKRIDHLPPIHQTGAKDCGAAALSAVLTYWSLPPIAPAMQRATIDAALRRSPKEGLSAGALRDYARKQGFRAYVFNGDVSDLRHEIDAGRPVIVGVLKSMSSREFLSHYEVVVGFHSKEPLVLLYDPARGLTENRVSGFLDEWKRAGYTTLVIAPEARQLATQAH
jgi:predicted double-glycine peptidase